jgi:hypothetical protein
MKYHFTEPNNCCTVVSGGSRLPFIHKKAGAGSDRSGTVAASVAFDDGPVHGRRRGGKRHA